MLKPTITKPGQAYFDDPVYVLPKEEKTDPMKLAVQLACGGALPEVKKPVLVGHERIPLRWMKPDGKGGLVPR